MTKDSALIRALWRSKYMLIAFLMFGTWEATQQFSHAKALLPLYLWGLPIQLTAFVVVVVWSRMRKSQAKDQAGNLR